MQRLPDQDLDHVLQRTSGLWEELRHQRVFITGGTGFIGCWLLETLAYANDRLRLDSSAVVLTRNPAAFRKKAPHLAADPSVALHGGDARDFNFPAGAFSHVIHAAPEVLPEHGESDGPGAPDNTTAGTGRTLEFARQCGARGFLLTSSGAVYGRQAGDVDLVPEAAYEGKPDQMSPASPYCARKRDAEHLCVMYSRMHGVPVKIARCFTFVGPYLPLAGHFAVGNFIRDGLAGGPIKVTGDGTPVRSYLYAADLSVWLWTILLRGESCRPYNVGSEQAVSIADTARAVSACFDPPPGVTFGRQHDPASPVERYVPSTERARRELGLEQTFDLQQAVVRTISWHRI